MHRREEYLIGAVERAHDLLGAVAVVQVDVDDRDALHQLRVDEQRVLRRDRRVVEKAEALAAAVIWGRLIEPGSDLSTWKWLRSNSSLSEFSPRTLVRFTRTVFMKLPISCWLIKIVWKSFCMSVKLNFFS